MELLFAAPQEIRYPHGVIFSRCYHQRDTVPRTDGVARSNSRAQDATEHDAVKLRGLPRVVKAGTLESMILRFVTNTHKAASHSTI